MHQLVNTEAKGQILLCVDLSYGNQHAVLTLKVYVNFQASCILASLEITIRRFD